ncbi:MBL fold metallo-hydrolase [Umezawaea sp. Da 62-37]|uniref:MBL fold metallo-hydrolase n=1 Tax=Umezawaea sp. Da 62-37 TaxID=3075927 RepID=UPI0028F7120C|nr:MBL fold metallo-hydrolase [Umezawaea sp. Da 62-37]WNV87520.1 MBL fold metallo-hydrolase [Umezawaea sp. Da 62-37]
MADDASRRKQRLESSGSPATTPRHEQADDSLFFVGTATTLLRFGPFTILTDPNFLHRGQWTHIGQGLVSRRRTDPAIDVDQLPPLDAVVLSHLHGDHFDRVASRALDRDLPIVTTAHAARRLGRRGFRETVALGTWSEFSLAKDGAELKVTAVPGRHALGALARVLPPVMGSVIEYRSSPNSPWLRVYLSGDTLVHENLREIAVRYPSLDVAVVHLGGTKVLGVLLTMDGRQGVDLVRMLEPRHTVPVHYDDYGRFKSPLSDFEAEVDRIRPPTKVDYVRRGDTFTFPEPGR